MVSTSKARFTLEADAVTGTEEWGSGARSSGRRSPRLAIDNRTKVAERSVGVRIGQFSYEIRRLDFDQLCRGTGGCSGHAKPKRGWVSG